MFRTRWGGFGVAAFLVWAGSPLAAQGPAGGERLPVVSGRGAVVLKRPPTVLVMSIELLGKGKDVAEALDKLKDRREAALLQLESLGADIDSVRFSEPSTSNSASALRSQFERMVRARVMSSGRATPKGLKLPDVVAVSTNLTARWPLSGETPEQRLVVSEQLEEKIRKSDLAGVKQADDTSEEEQELMEEMEATMGGGMFGNDEEVPPGTPQFIYGANITPQEREAAMAEAYQKAKQQAARLAAAAGAELGPLANLSQGGASSDDPRYEMYQYGYGMPGAQRVMMQLMRDAAISGEGESFSQEFGTVTFQFSITAGFHLRPGAGP